MILFRGGRYLPLSASAVRFLSGQTVPGCCLSRNLLPTLPAGISVNLKTGTLDGVKSYAGYITARNGDLLCYAIVSNNHDCSSKAVGDKLNKILLKIATLY